MFGGSINTGNSGAVNGGVPLVYPEVLRDLADKLESPAIASRFATDYMDLWELRLSRLGAALKRNDFPAAVDAVISLRVASIMVGAGRLAGLAQEVENEVNRGDFVAGRQLLAAVGVCGAETVQELGRLCNPELALCSRHL